MREIRLYGSEGGAGKPRFYPYLSTDYGLRNNPNCGSAKYIIDETVTRLSYDVSIKVASKFYNGLKNSESQREICVLVGDTNTQEQAMKLLLKFADKKISLSDATSAILMKAN